jgi:uncharacterized protein YndB with AHSA1/START domain
VHALDARLGGSLRYDVIASSPEAIEGMKKIGMPPMHKTHGKFSELKPQERLAMTHMMDFLPGVPPYENTMVVELFPTGGSVRMAVTLTPMHDGDFSQMQREGLNQPAHKARSPVRALGRASVRHREAPPRRQCQTRCTFGPHPALR